MPRLAEIAAARRTCGGSAPAAGGRSRVAAGPVPPVVSTPAVSAPANPITSTAYPIRVISLTCVLIRA
jgi:hypothetical protein